MDAEGSMTIRKVWGGLSAQDFEGSGPKILGSRWWSSRRQIFTVEESRAVPADLDLETKRNCQEEAR